MSDPPPLRIEHVHRPALPWRPEDLTECGITAAGRPCISHDELRAKIKREGAQRALYTTCQTCLDTAQRHEPWALNPTARLEREVHAARWAEDKRDRLNAELRAIELLISAHQEALEALGTTTDFAKAQKARRTKAHPSNPRRLL